MISSSFFYAKVNKTAIKKVQEITQNKKKENDDSNTILENKATLYKDFIKTNKTNTKSIINFTSSPLQSNINNSANNLEVYNSTKQFNKQYYGSIAGTRQK